MEYLMLNPVETEAPTDFSDALNCCTLTEGLPSVRKVRAVAGKSLV
jgi:hypothetical protein